MENSELPQFWSYRQASQQLGLPLGTLYSLVHQKRIPHHRVSPRLVLFSPTETIAWVKSNPFTSYKSKKRGARQ